MENENDIKVNPNIPQDNKDNNQISHPENGIQNQINPEVLNSQNNESQNPEKKIKNIDQDLALNRMDIEDNIENNNNDEQNSQNSKDEINNELNDTKKEKNPLMRYPLAKIKNIMKLDTDIKLCQKDAYIVIGKLTEFFLQDLAQGAYNICKSCKRKTINLEDINSAIKMNPKMGFINFNSIFYVQELNKIKKRATSSKNIEKNIPKEKIEESEKNINNNNEPKEKKKRGKTSNKGKTTVKSNDVINNKTLDSMFGL